MNFPQDVKRSFRIETDYLPEAGIVRKAKKGENLYFIASDSTLAGIPNNL